VRVCVCLGRVSAADDEDMCLVDDRSATHLIECVLRASR